MEDPADPEAAVHEALSRKDYKQALSLLIELYEKSVYSHCCSILGDATLAEDARQTTFTQAYKDLPSYRGRSTLRLWLYGITRHRCFDMLKMRRREGKHVEQMEAPPDIPTLQPSVEEQLHLDSISKQLARCLAHLDVRVREAIWLRYMEQLSFEEMSQLTDTRAATLQMRVARALPGLLQCLEASGVTL